MQEQLVEVIGKVGTDLYEEEFLSNLGALRGKDFLEHK